MLLDMDAIAGSAGAMVNAVMLGALAGCGRLPIPLEAFEAAIRPRRQGGESNLRGFRAGLAATRDPAPRAPAHLPPPRPPPPRCRISRARSRRCRPRPARWRPQGTRRLARYQDAAYARLYLDRLAPIGAAHAQAGAGGRLLARDRAAAGAAHVLRGRGDGGAGQDRSGALRAHRGRASGRGRASRSRSRISSKPGIEELCSILPVRLARSILPLAERAATGSTGSTGAWRSRPRRSPASGASGCSPRLQGLRRRSHPLRTGAAGHRGRPRPRGCCCRALGRAGAGDRGLRRPDQGLRRHPRARQPQL